MKPHSIKRETQINSGNLQITKTISGSNNTIELCLESL
ncbi:hypothetical protein NIES2104_06110 [Leptolyngbya sp. NIES-2104]|nr:hypothetical protein NIES2104_06110 [Leptolyngbya sp. NIES-2104]